MSEPRTCYLPHMTVLFCTGVERLGPDIGDDDVIGLEGRR